MDQQTPKKLSALIGEASRKRLKPAYPQQLSEMGKLPPQALDLEEAVLGAIMLEKDALTNVLPILKPESFYKESHQRIYAGIVDLFNENEPVDILTVTNKLRGKGELEIVGGPFYITQLTNRVASSANAEFHARIIAQKYIQRELIRVSSDAIQKAYEEGTDVFDLLDETQRDLFGIIDGNVRKGYDNMHKLVTEAIKQIEIAKNKGDGLTGVESGFTKLDRITSGWQKSDLVIIGARPGMGKTAFVLSMARNAAVRFNKPIAIFSLEMASLQLVNRLIASETELSAEKLKKGQLENHEFEQLNAKITPLIEAPLFIDDTPALSMFELRAKARKLKEEKDIQMIIIDYLQLMVVGGDNRGNREQEISTISRSLKSLAKELNIPIIALSQLSRAGEAKQGSATRRPQLSDLRESGAIEQDADMVLFIYRPEYYGLTENEEGRSTKGIAEIIIAKHRNGALDTVELRFHNHLAKFADLEDSGNDFSYDANAGIAPSTDFNLPPSNIIRGSKMNDIDDETEAPF